MADAAHRYKVGDIEVTVLTDVVELLDDGRALGVHRVGDRPESRNDRVVRVAEVAASEHRCRVHRHGLDHDHGRAAASALDVVREVLTSGQAALAHVGGVGPEHHPVAQGQVAKAKR